MQKQNPKQLPKSLNPFHNEKKIESKPRRNINLKNIIEEVDEMPFIYGNRLLFTLTTNFSICDYNKIFEKYKEKKAPIILVDGNFQFDEKTQDVLRDVNDPETKAYNSYINKIRTIELLRLCTEYLDIPEDNDIAISILSDLGNDIFEKINEQLQKIVLHKQSELKERKHLMCREALAYTINEKAFINEKRREMGLTVSNNKKGEPVDGRKCDVGITREYLIIQAAEKFGWSLDYISKILKDDLTEEESAVLELILAKSELDTENEIRLHKELDDKHKNK